MKVTLTLQATPGMLGALVYLGIVKPSSVLLDQDELAADRIMGIAFHQAADAVNDPRKWVDGFVKELVGAEVKVEVEIEEALPAPVTAMPESRSPGSYPPPPAAKLIQGYERMPRSVAGDVPCMVDWDNLKTDARIFETWQGMPRQLQLAHAEALHTVSLRGIMEIVNREKTRRIIAEAKTEVSKKRAGVIRPTPKQAAKFAESIAAGSPNDEQREYTLTSWILGAQQKLHHDDWEIIRRALGFDPDKVLTEYPEEHLRSYAIAIAQYLAAHSIDIPGYADFAAKVKPRRKAVPA